MALTDWGETPAPQDLSIVRQALVEKAKRFCQNLNKAGKLSPEQLASLTEGDALNQIVIAGERLWAPVRI